ncbi:MAG TPA: alanine--tRNA ligase [Chitinophagaceae bacterium]|jgi:alanyl-tRNA synthetase|nr:alanine--tRNA ligase [Chitinophagaceae bacterium]
MMTSTEIRQHFLDFFKSKGHVIVPSAPIVIKDDPTLMFTNAGMNQFKDYFLGNKQAANKRVADTQKCLRVSGKHNDLEEVGVDTYHHTMFEMLGNWSFGDYFKKEAIEWSWELLTKIYKIPEDRLYVTVFEGDINEKLPKDAEAITEWKKWIAEERVLLCGRKDNFWEMGDTGPCGPCTEIHVDCRSDEERKKLEGKKLVNNDHPQVIEIWNNVFIQFNRLRDGSLEPLPAKHVDTGMGLERLTMVLQGKTSSYDTDIFSGTIQATEKITGKKYTNSDNKQDVAFRVIADHIRAIGFTIADGQLPSNTGAGYVIRRILRRAVRYYFSYLDYKQPLLCQLMPLLAHQFENVFSELQKQIDFVSKVVKEEEEAFLRTLDKGIKRFEEYRSEKLEEIGHAFPGNHPSKTLHTEEWKQEIAKGFNKKILIDGKFAFELYDTYGFPVDLTELMAREIGWAVDMQGFEAEMQQQKNRSRAATAIDTEDWVVVNESAQNHFVGYDNLESETKIIKYRKVKAKGKESFQLVLETTPFYAESGGQVGDTGELILPSPEGDGPGVRLKVTDTKKENELIIHFVDQLPADINGKVIARVDAKKRRNTAWHHSATHLLHAALRTVLGTHVIQKGSLVNAEHLRFDFSHFAKMTDEEITEVEELVNEKIRDNIPVVIKMMPKDEALKLGAMALFGEKYSDIVRVVIIDPAYSIELCGGTHVGATGDLGFFKITNETAVAAGVRRIEAVCGKLAEDYVNEELKLINGIRGSLKNSKDLSKAINTIINENAELKKKLEKLETRQLEVVKKELLQKVIQLNGTSFIGEIVEVGNADSLKRLCYELKNELSNYVVVLASNIEGKAQVAILLDEKLAASKNLEASKIIKEYVAPLIKGGGGGQKTLATAGGQDASKLKLVIEKVKELL